MPELKLEMDNRVTADEEISEALAKYKDIIERQIIEQRQQL